MCAPFTNLVVLAKNNTESIYNSYEQYSEKLPLKCQLINGPCWAFASMASLEVFLAKKGILEESLSEKHLLSWVRQGDGNQGFNSPIYEGGTFFMATAYFTSGNGPVFAREMPYDTKDCVFDKIAREKVPAYFVKGIKLINSDIESIKSAITEYGAVTAGCEINNFKHGVSVVGWNSYLKRWAVRDSGCQEGYRWLPFDTNFFDCISFTDVERYNNKKNIYQYDEFGIPNSVSSSEFLCCANVYDFKDDETLDSVMINSYSEGALCDLYYAPVLSDGTPNNDMKTWIKLNSEKVPHKGYTTFCLKNKLKLKKGKGVIIVKISGEGDTDKILGVSCQDNKINLLPKTNISYVLLNDTFFDVNDISILKDERVHAFSIKAITNKK